MLTVESEDYVSLVKTHKKKCNTFYGHADQDSISWSVSIQFY